VVIAVSESFVTVAPFLLLGGGLAAYLLRRFYRTPRGRRVVDGALLKAPVVGIVLRKVAVARFCRTLATLLASGVPILDGLAITAKTAGNAIVEDAVMTARGSIEGGESVSAPLEQTQVFPAMVTQMINIGEATGALDTMLSKIADFYEEEVDVAVSGMLSLLEPIMIAFLGVVVGGIVIAMYMPIFDLIGRMAA
jgi:type IV pilus assembly protein PilC